MKADEWTGLVALEYGYLDWKKQVWQHARNSDLRSRRPDPRVLAKGDELFIPAWEEKQETCDTEKKHTFELPTNKEVIRIRVVGPDGKLLKDKEYKLKLKGGRGCDEFEQEHKKTDSDGKLEENLPITATSAVLDIMELAQKIEFRLGHLTPLDLDDKPVLICGAQQRLRALGFDPGPIDGLDGPRTRAGVRGFQAFCKDHDGDSEYPWVIDSGPVDGIVGPKTKKALLHAYGA